MKAEEILKLIEGWKMKAGGSYWKKKCFRYYNKHGIERGTTDGTDYWGSERTIWSIRKKIDQVEINLEKALKKPKSD